MRDRGLRIILAFSLLFILPVAPALQADPLQRSAEASLDSPTNLLAAALVRFAAWLGLHDRPEPELRPVVAPDDAGGDPPTRPLGDDGTCLNPDGQRVPCTS